MKLYHIIKLLSSSGELNHQMSRISKNNYQKQMVFVNFQLISNIS